MASIDEIQAIIRDKGAALALEDIREIEYQLTQVPVEQAREAEPWIWEAVGLVVNAPEYEGDGRLPAYL